MLNVGIIGIGRIVKDYYLPAFEKLSDKYNIVAICNKNKIDEGRKIAQLLGARHFQDVQEMISSMKFDMIVIASYATTHYEMINACISRGIRILVEKPLTTSIELSRQLLERVAPKEVYISFQRRFHPHVIYAKKLLSQNSLGIIKHIICTNIHCRNIEYYKKKNGGTLDGGGVLINQAIHSIDLLYYLFGKFGNILYSKKNNDFLDILVEDTFTSIFFMDNGAMVNFIATTGSLIEEGYKMTILGTEGSIMLSPFEFYAKIRDNDDDLEFILNENVNQDTLFYHQLNSLFNTVSNNNIETMCTMYDGFYIHDFVNKLYKKVCI